jgi:KDO2-lipid IV(A) lauroyltransferase
MPKRFVYFLGTLFGLMSYHLGVRRKVVDANLDIAFGNSMSIEERQKLTKKVFINIGRMFFEVLMLNFIKQEELAEHISIEGLDELQKALDENKGVVIAGAHYGNWELLSAGISTFGTPITGYAGLQKNQLFDDAINKVRGKFGMKMINKSRSAPAQMLKALKNNGILGILGDLNVPRESLFVDFFGVKAAMGTGLATFTLLKKCPLLFIWIEPIAPLKHKGHIIRINYELSGNKDLDRQKISQLITSTLEDKIREKPEYYFWVNRRWKTRPPNEKDIDYYP